MSRGRALVVPAGERDRRETLRRLGAAIVEKMAEDRARPGSGNARMGEPPQLAVRLVGALVALAVAAVQIRDQAGITPLTSPTWPWPTGPAHDAWRAAWRVKAAQQRTEYATVRCGKSRGQPHPAGRRLSRGTDRRADLLDVMQVLDDHDDSRDEQEESHGRQDLHCDSPEHHAGDGER